MAKQVSYEKFLQAVLKKHPDYVEPLKTGRVSRKQVVDAALARYPEFEGKVAPDYPAGSATLGAATELAKGVPAGGVNTLTQAAADLQRVLVTQPAVDRVQDYQQTVPGAETYAQQLINYQGSIPQEIENPRGGSIRQQQPVPTGANPFASGPMPMAGSVPFSAPPAATPKNEVLQRNRPYDAATVPPEQMVAAAERYLADQGSRDSQYTRDRMTAMKSSDEEERMQRLGPKTVEDWGLGQAHLLDAQPWLSRHGFAKGARATGEAANSQVLSLMAGGITGRIMLKALGAKKAATAAGRKTIQSWSSSAASGSMAGYQGFTMYADMLREGVDPDEAKRLAKMEVLGTFFLERIGFDRIFGEGRGAGGMIKAGASESLQEGADTLKGNLLSMMAESDQQTVADKWDSVLDFASADPEAFRNKLFEGLPEALAAGGGLGAGGFMLSGQFRKELDDIRELDYALAVDDLLDESVGAPQETAPVQETAPAQEPAVSAEEQQTRDDAVARAEVEQGAPPATAPDSSTSIPTGEGQPATSEGVDAVRTDPRIRAALDSGRSIRVNPDGDVEILSAADPVTGQTQVEEILPRNSFTKTSEAPAPAPAVEEGTTSPETEMATPEEQAELLNPEGRGTQAKSRKELQQRYDEGYKVYRVSEQDEGGEGFLRVTNQEQIDQASDVDAFVMLPPDSEPTNVDNQEMPDGPEPVSQPKSPPEQPGNGSIPEPDARRAEDQKELDNLRTSIVGRRGEGVESSTSESQIDITLAPRQSVDERLEGRLGVRIVRFNSKNMSSIGGAQTGDSNTIFINEDRVKNAENPDLWVIGHETMHVVEKRAPAAYKKFEEVVLENAKPGAIEQQIQILRDSYKAAGLTVPEGQALRRLATREVMSDLAGDVMTRKSFWVSLKDRSPEAFQTALEVIETMFRAMQGRKGTFRSTKEMLGAENLSAREYTRKVQAIRRAALDAVRESKQASPRVAGATRMTVSRESETAKQKKERAKKIREAKKKERAKIKEEQEKQRAKRKAIRDARLEGKKTVQETKTKYPEALPLRIKKDSSGRVAVEEVKNSDGEATGEYTAKYKQESYGLLKPPNKPKTHRGAVKKYGTKLADEIRAAIGKPEIAKAVGWYGWMRDYLQKQFGANIEVFSQLLGATSARTPVAANFQQALQALLQMSKGHYDVLMTEFHNHVLEVKRKQEDGTLFADWESEQAKKKETKLAENPDKPYKKPKYDESAAYRKAINAFEKVPLRPNGKKYNANSQQVLKVLYGNWLELTVGPKTPNFAGNLSGRTTAPTIDVWAARILRRIMYQPHRTKWRLLPQQEKGVAHSRDRLGNVTGEFGFAQEIFVEAAQQLNMAPDDVQALAWFIEKDVWEGKGWTGVAGAEKSSFENEATALEYDRYTLGVTTFQDEISFDSAKHEATRKKLRRVLSKIPNLAALRVTSSEGEYMAYKEPAFDVEASISIPEGPPDAKLIARIEKNFAKAVIAVGQPNNQWDVFVSKRVEQDHPNARPCLEVGFSDPESTPGQWRLKHMMRKMRRRGIDGFTIAKDERGRIIGFRVQFIPEFVASREEWADDKTEWRKSAEQALDPKLAPDAAEQWANSVRGLLDDMPPGLLSYVIEGTVSTHVYGKEEYSNARIKPHNETSLKTELGRRKQTLKLARPVRINRGKTLRRSRTIGRGQGVVQQGDGAPSQGVGPPPTSLTVSRTQATPKAGTVHADTQTKINQAIQKVGNLSEPIRTSSDLPPVPRGMTRVFHGVLDIRNLGAMVESGIRTRDKNSVEQENFVSGYLSATKTDFGPVRLVFDVPSSDVVVAGNTAKVSRDISPSEILAVIRDPATVGKAELRDINSRISSRVPVTEQELSRYFVSTPEGYTIVSGIAFPSKILQERQTGIEPSPSGPGAEPGGTITRDADGNVIPLSERFNPDTDDIRFSVTRPEATPEKRGRFLDQVDARDDLHPEIVKALEDVTYAPKSVEGTMRDANVLFNHWATVESVDFVVSKIKDWENGMRPSMRMALAQRTILHYNDRRKDTGEPQFADKAADMALWVDNSGREFGRGIQILSAFQYLDEAGLIRYGERALARHRETERGRSETVSKKLKETVQKINESATDEVLSTPAVERAVKTAAKKAATRARRKSGPLAGLDKKIAEADAALKEFFGTEEGGLSVSRPAGTFFTASRKQIPKGILDKLVLVGANVLDEQMKTRGASPDALDAHSLWIDEMTSRYGPNVDPYLSAIWPDANTAYQQILVAQEAKIQAKATLPPPQKQNRISIDALIRESLADRINDVVGGHYALKDAVGVDLKRRLMSEFSLSAQEASELVLTIGSAFDRITSKTKKAELKKILGKRAASNPIPRPKERELHDTIIRMSNLGAFSDDSLNDLVADKLGLPKVTPKVRNTLATFATEIAKTPDGFLKKQKVAEMHDYLRQLMVPIDGNWGRNGAWSNREVLTSLWYSSMLSGFQTHERNVTSTFWQMANEIAVFGAQNPKQIPAIVRSLVHGLPAGFSEFWAVLRTGNIPIRTDIKMEASAILETNPFVGFAKILNHWKYVTRAMIGQDMLFFKVAEEAHAFAVADMIVRDHMKKTGFKLSRRQVIQQTKEVLGLTEDQMNAWTEQAEYEGVPSRQVKRRARELAEQSRGEDFGRDETDMVPTEFAQRSTFNYEPEGVLGDVARLLGTLHSKTYGVTRLLVPFTRIVANVTQMSFDMSPFGIARGGMHHWNGTMSRAKVSTLYAKGAMGTFLMGAIYMLDSMDEDEDESKRRFVINGSGPQNFARRKVWLAAGNKPYSIKWMGPNGKQKSTSFLLTPMAIPLAVIAEVREAGRNKELDEVDLAARIAFSMVTAGSVIMNQSFLSGLADFSAILTEENDLKAMRMMERWAARTTSGLMGPAVGGNLAKQLEKIWDPTIYEANDLIAMLISDVPVVRSRIGAKPRLNIWGQPIRLRGKKPMLSFSGDNVWNTQLETDPVTVWLADAEAKHARSLFSAPSKQTELNGVSDDDQAERYYMYVKESGRAIKAEMEKHLPKLRKISDGDELKAYIQKEIVLPTRNPIRDAIKDNLTPASRKWPR